MSDKTCATDAVIVSGPKWVEYTCPHCGDKIIDPFSNFDDGIWYGDYETSCPKCDKDVILEDVDYD
jgi:uncharacterized Zn finger protein (UPF0148 family)